jgi:hypothetical protein
MDFAELFDLRRWVAIRNCPGRYALPDGAVTESPEAITGQQGQEFHSAAARDVVVVVEFASGGGLISYKRPGGLYIHTLNTVDGFERKIRDLQIDLRSAF